MRIVTNYERKIVALEQAPRLAVMKSTHYH